MKQKNIKKEYILEKFEHYLKNNLINKNYVNRFDVNNFIEEIKKTQKELTIKDIDDIENIIYENYMVNCKDLWEVVDEDTQLENDFENALSEIYDNANDKEVLKLATTLVKHATMRLDSDLEHLDISKEYARLYNICWQLQEIIDCHV